MNPRRSGLLAAAATATFAIVAASDVGPGSKTGSGVLHWPDTAANREYALDALSLEYVADYTSDPRTRERISSLYWCGTPIDTELAAGRLPPAELTEVALRHRAQRLVARATDIH